MFAFLAPLLLNLSPVGSFLKTIPPKVWYAIGIIAALFAAYLIHHHVVHKALAAEYQRGMADEAAHIEKQALAIKQKADALNAGIASAIRSKNDEQNRAIAADAGTIRVLGPGKAACHPVLPAAPGGPVAPSGSGNAPVAPVPSTGGQQLIALPFDDTLDFGQNHDSYRVEVLSWHTWYAKLVAAWPTQPAPSR